MGFHAPGVAPELLGASGALVGWAVIADGPLGVTRRVTLATHRRGLGVLVVALLALPFASAHWRNVALLAPCLVAGVVLGRLALVRWPVMAAPDPASTTRMGRLGRAAGRAVGHELDVELPRRARRAGHTVGRSWQGRARRARGTSPQPAGPVRSIVGPERSGPSDHPSSPSS